LTDILSQDEIDALLSALDSGDISHEEFGGAQGGDARARLYDFKRPDKFSKDQLRTIHFLHETFGRIWASSLSGMLRNLVNMTVVSVDQLTYKEFLLAIPDPSVICVFSMPPLEGRAILEFSPAIAFPIIDRLLGGHGSANQRIRELSDIEKRIISTLVEEGLSFLKEAWMSMMELYPEMETVESNPMFVQVVPPNDMVLLLTLESKIGDFTGVINLCYPYTLLEPILTRLSQQFLISSTGRGATEHSRKLVLETLRETKLEIDVVLGEAELPMGDVLNMREGDLVKLEAKTDDELKVIVGEKLKFAGVPGTVDGKMAVMITRYITNPEEMIKDVRV
jgi:flagellar motor switch protein FliM